MSMLNTHTCSASHILPLQDCMELHAMQDSCDSVCPSNNASVRRLELPDLLHEARHVATQSSPAATDGPHLPTGISRGSPSYKHAS